MFLHAGKIPDGLDIGYGVIPCLRSVRNDAPPWNCASTPALLTALPKRNGALGSHLNIFTFGKGGLAFLTGLRRLKFSSLAEGHSADEWIKKMKAAAGE